MRNCVESIGLDRLVEHLDNANRQSRENFNKLVRNIERTGMYEPLVVRHHPKKKGCYQIINGHHRCKALAKLGYDEAECVVWDVDDDETDVLLSTLNRLRGSDDIGKKRKILRRLSGRSGIGELSKILPGTKSQIERLANSKVSRGVGGCGGKAFANSVVFFLNDEQQKIVESALGSVEVGVDIRTRAGRRAAALACVVEKFVRISKVRVSGDGKEEVFAEETA